MYKIVCKSLRTATMVNSGDYSLYADFDEAKAVSRYLDYPRDRLVPIGEVEEKD